MFSRSQRISSLLFDTILAQGRSYRTSHFSLALLQNTSHFPEKTIKLALIVPKKVAQKALKRNRLRRQARAWLENHLPSQMPISHAGLVIFITKAWEGPFPPEFALELQSLLSKIGVMV